MKVTGLIENTSISEQLECEHGLSLYVEIGKRKLLFDVGGSDLFLKNAKELKLDIADVDYLVISHGHADHGGGIPVFLSENKKAKLFLQPSALEAHYSFRADKKFYDIGLEHTLQQNERVVFTTENFTIEEGIEVFWNVPEKYPKPISNSNLYRERNGQKERDIFLHEQNLVLIEHDKMMLITGCSHNGIVNIVEHFNTLYRRYPDVVIGGFHLVAPSVGTGEKTEVIEQIGQILLKTGAKYYTCHCTGMEAYQVLKNKMQKKIDYFATGSKITLI